MLKNLINSRLWMTVIATVSLFIGLCALCAGLYFDLPYLIVVAAAFAPVYAFSSMRLDEMDTKQLRSVRRFDNPNE